MFKLLWVEIVGRPITMFTSPYYYTTIKPFFIYLLNTGPYGLIFDNASLPSLLLSLNIHLQNIAGEGPLTDAENQIKLIVLKNQLHKSLAN